MNKWKWRTLTTELCFWVMTSATGQIEGLAVAYVDDFMVAVHEESPVSQKHFSDVKARNGWGRMGIWFFHPLWSADRATPTPGSLEWFLFVLCTLRGIDGSPGFVISKTKAA